MAFSVHRLLPSSDSISSLYGSSAIPNSWFETNSRMAESVLFCTMAESVFYKYFYRYVLKTKPCARCLSKVIPVIWTSRAALIVIQFRACLGLNSSVVG